MLEYDPNNKLNTIRTRKEHVRDKYLKNNSKHVHFKCVVFGLAFDSSSAGDVLLATVVVHLGVKVPCGLIYIFVVQLSINAS